MISQKESSINIDPETYAKVMDIQRQYRVARENGWYVPQEYAPQEQMASQMADASASLNELVARVRCLTREVWHLKEIVDAKGLVLDASIEEIYGDKT